MAQSGTVKAFRDVCPTSLVYCLHDRGGERPRRNPDQRHASTDQFRRNSGRVMNRNISQDSDK